MRYTVVALLLVVGCEASTPAGRTLTKDEEIVRKHIMANAHNPKSIEIAKWGPHMDIKWPFPDVTAAQLNLPQPKGKPAKMIRVVFRGTNEFGAITRRDKLLIVQDSKVVDVTNNDLGDDYQPVVERTQKAVNGAVGIWQNHYKK